MKINLAQIKQTVGGELQFDFHKQHLEVDLNREGIKSVGPVRIKGNVENLGKRIFQVSGQIEITAHGTCARCLTDVNVNFNIDFELKFSNKDQDLNENEIIFFQGDEIDLYPHVVSEIILNWPSRILCKKDCKGLCPQCGANLNIDTCKCKVDNVDPRFAVLKQLLNDK